LVERKGGEYSRVESNAPTKTQRIALLLNRGKKLLQTTLKKRKRFGKRGRPALQFKDMIKGIRADQRGRTVLASGERKEKIGMHVGENGYSCCELKWASRQVKDLTENPKRVDRVYIRRKDTDGGKNTRRCSTGTSHV